MSRVALVACTFLSASLVTAAGGFELNGRALGQRVDDVLNDPQYDCGGESACFLFMACVLKDAQRESLHGVALENMTLYYAGERVAAIEAAFEPMQFEQVLRGATEAFGAAQPEISPHPVPGNVLVLWRQGSRVMRLERYFAATGRGSLIITDRSFLAQLVERAGK